MNDLLFLYHYAYMYGCGYFISISAETPNIILLQTRLANTTTTTIKP